VSKPAEKPARRGRKAAAASEPAVAPEAETPLTEPAAPEAAAAAKPARARRRKAEPADVEAGPLPATDETEPLVEADIGNAEAGDAETEGEDGTPRRGWWQRTFGN
jgi:ribonuclease E